MNTILYIYILLYIIYYIIICILCAFFRQKKYLISITSSGLKLSVKKEGDLRTINHKLRNGTWMVKCSKLVCLSIHPSS